LEDDDVSSFQQAYMGLEALEPALAEQIGVTSGSEETKGNCEACGAEFTRRRTVLNGVRVFIGSYPKSAIEVERFQMQQVGVEQVGLNPRFI
jgi:hypothetical protein